MSSKSLVLSASGLKNLVIKEQQDDQFHFIFGKNTISMSNVFAEFISPRVSNIHKSDPLVNSIILNNQFDEVVINENVISKFQLISRGETIDINEEEIIQMKIISILIENTELYYKLNDLYSNTIDESNIDQYLTNLTTLSKISPTYEYINYPDIIDLISRQFYAIDKNKLKQLPKPILYSIISNSNLQIESEDTLIDFVNDIFTNEGENKDIISFYEQIEFSHLSENKLEEFLDSFSPSEMTNELWMKLRRCFFSSRNRPSPTGSKNRYRVMGKKFEYDGNDSHRLCGIIDHLTKESGGNVSDNGTVKLTASSTHSSFYPRNVVDFNNLQNFYHSKDAQNSWLKFDFVGRKVSPTGYSIRTRPSYDSYHPRQWVIEGTNVDSDKDSDWTVLDTRQNETSLSGVNVTRTFEIQNKSESYRFLRIRQTGTDSSGDHYFLFSALEFFGILIDEQQ